MKILNKISYFLDHLEDFAVYLACAIIAFIIILVTVNVVLRTVFNSPISWEFDISTMLLLYIPFIAAAWVLRRDGHVRIDIVYNTLPLKMRHVLDIMNAILGAAVFLALTYFGSSVTANSIAHHIMEQDLNIPRYIAQIIMPIGSFLLFLRYAKLTGTLIIGAKDRVEAPARDKVSEAVDIDGESI